ncbi:hypothetical protein FQN57_005990 [Myotisia sp. PD_48]|nr:hypothetical protein FQN57_005990 [Myotisia sp. PD_48]
MSLNSLELQPVVYAIAQKLDLLNLVRRTGGVDLVIHVDHRNITADQLTNQLLTMFPSEFQGISQYGHTIPAYKVSRPGGDVQLVEVEVFDYQSWPQRPQYNIQASSRRVLNINGQPVKVFAPEWLLREKILSQYQRQGTLKERTDHEDIMRMIPLSTPGTPELDFNQREDLQTALANFVQKKPTLAQLLKAKIRCSIVFQN